MHKWLSVLLIFGAWTLAGCGQTAAGGKTSTAPPAAAAATATELPATPTPSEPLALIVNGEGVPQRVFTAELQRMRQAAAETGPADPEQQAERVRQYLIDQVLLAQAAREQGFALSEDELYARVQALAQSLGEESFASWLKQQGYTEASFRDDLRRDLAAAWMRDQIIASVPATVEQVHLFQILLYNEEDARRVQAQLQAGQDFLTLARQYDPQTGGDLGWLPPEALLDADLAAAVASLPVGAVSEPLADLAGYHLFYVQAREARPLSGEVRLRLQQAALENWLADRRAASEILVVP